MDFPPRSRHRGLAFARRKKILVIDDDEVHLTAISAWLVSAGYEVVTHLGAVGVAPVVFAERPAIVVLDVVMPHLTGVALARLLSRTWRSFGIGIVFYSAVDPTRSGPLADLPVLGTIAKTSDGERFLEQFEELVERRSLEKDFSQIA